VLKKKIWANFQRIVEVFTKKIVKKLLKIWSWDPGSEIRDPEKTYSGSRSQKGTGSRIRNTVRKRAKKFTLSNFSCLTLSSLCRFVASSWKRTRQSTASKNSTFSALVTVSLWALQDVFHYLLVFRLGSLGSKGIRIRYVYSRSIRQRVT
jgi:hypothetical protein